MFYIYHHLGLGDHIICNSIVREYAKNYYRVAVFCKKHNSTSARFLYRDTPNVVIIEVENDNEVIKFLYRIPVNDFLVIGAYGRNWETEGTSFDKVFYKQACLPISKKFECFRLKRDPLAEKELLSKYDSFVGGDYFFMHNDIRRNMIISKIKVCDCLISPVKEYTDNIFDYCLLIENAKEVHCINSSFLHLADMIETTGELFFHKYARNDSGDFDIPVLRKNWTVIE